MNPDFDTKPQFKVGDLVRIAVPGGQMGLITRSNFVTHTPDGQYHYVSVLFNNGNHPKRYRPDLLEKVASELP